MVKYTNGIEINGNGRKHKSSDVNYTRLDSGYISYNRIIQSNRMINLSGQTQSILLPPK